MVGIPGIAMVMQAAHAPGVPVAPHGSAQAAKPSPIAGMKTLLAWPMMKLKIEPRHCRGTPPLSVLLSPVLSLLLFPVLRESRGLARTVGLS